MGCWSADFNILQTNYLTHTNSHDRQQQEDYDSTRFLTSFNELHHYLITIAISTGQSLLQRVGILLLRKIVTYAVYGYMVETRELSCSLLSCCSFTGKINPLRLYFNFVWV